MADRKQRSPREDWTVSSLVRGRLLRGSAWILGGRVATILLSLLINWLLAQLLTPTEFGAYFATFSLVSIGSIIALLGMDRVIVRLMSADIGLGNQSKARSAVRVAYAYVGAGAVGTALCVTVIGGWLARDVYHSSIIAAGIPLTAVWLAVTAIQTLLVETFRGFHRFDFVTIFDALLIDILTSSVLLAFLFLHLHTTYSTVLDVSVLVAFVVTLVAGLTMYPRIRRLRGGVRSVSHGTGEVIRIGLPLLVTNVAIYLLGTGIDIWVLAAFRPSEVFFYAGATRLVLYVAAPYTILQGVTPPLIAELYAQDRKRELQHALRSVAAIAGLPALIVLLVFVVYGHFVLSHVYRPIYAQGAMVLAVLSLGRVVTVWTGSSGISLMMTGHQRAVMVVTIAFGLLSIAFGVLGAALFGAIGVATATAGAAALANIAQLLVAKRATGIWTLAYVSPRPLLNFLRRPEPV